MTTHYCKTKVKYLIEVKNREYNTIIHRKIIIIWLYGVAPRPNGTPRSFYIQFNITALRWGITRESTGTERYLSSDVSPTLLTALPSLHLFIFFSTTTVCRFSTAIYLSPTRNVLLKPILFTSSFSFTTPSNQPPYPYCSPLFHFTFRPPPHPNFIANKCGYIHTFTLVQPPHTVRPT